MPGQIVNLGIGRISPGTESDHELIDAGGAPGSIVRGASFFDSSVSFAMVRRGRMDVTFMGAFQVDELGNLSNWRIPGKFSPGIGGAMELAQKVRRVIVLCSHNDKEGNPKILRRCRLPLTAPRFTHHHRQSGDGCDQRGSRRGGHRRGVVPGGDASRVMPW